MKKRRTLKKYKKVIFKADPFYDSYWLGKFFNKFMRGGKKHLVEQNFLKSFKKIQSETNLANLYFFFTILTKFRPLFGFISKRFGKQFKKIPVPLYPRRQIITSLKWLVLSIRVNRLPRFELRVISEFLDLHAKKKLLYENVIQIIYRRLTKIVLIIVFVESNFKNFPCAIFSNKKLIHT